MLEVCYRCGVKVMTIYAFSIENFKRSRYEVDALMSLMKLKLSQLSEHGELFEQYGARVKVLGRRDLLAPDVVEAIERAEELTRDNGDAILNVCFPYTSRNEIAVAIRNTVEDYSRPVPERGWAPFSQSEIEHKIRARNLAAVSPASTLDNGTSPTPSALSDTEDSTVDSNSPPTPPDADLPTDDPKENERNRSNFYSYPDPESITEATLDEHMLTAGMPPIDLFLRTSGVERFSDFLLWQAHQDTDVEFVSCMWPEFDLWHFLPVLLEWQWKRRKALAEEKLVVRRRRSKKTGNKKVQ